MAVVLVLWRHTNSLKLPGSSHTEHPQQVESLVKIVFHGGKSVALHWPTTNIASHTGWKQVATAQVMNSALSYRKLSDSELYPGGLGWTTVRAGQGQLPAAPVP